MKADRLLVEKLLSVSICLEKLSGLLATRLFNHYFVYFKYQPLRSLFCMILPFGLICSKHMKKIRTIELKF